MTTAEEIKTPAKGYSILEGTIKKVPWLDILMGLFIPMNLMHYFFHARMPLQAIFIAIAWCLAYSAIVYLRKKSINMLSLITAFMIFINFLTSFLSHYKLIYKTALFLDNSLIGLLFLGSLLTSTPLVLKFLDSETLEKIPDKIKNTKYYIKAWSIITAVWGIVFLLNSIIIAVLKEASSSFLSTADFISGWPTVVILYIFSVNYPIFYWKSKLK